MFASNNLSAADVAAVTGGNRNNGFGDGTLQHGDMTTMTPDEQLNHLKMDVETMWRDATPEQRKRIKESLTKWSTTLTV